MKHKVVAYTAANVCSKQAQAPPKANTAAYYETLDQADVALADKHSVTVLMWNTCLS